MIEQRESMDRCLAMPAPCFVSEARGSNAERKPRPAGSRWVEVGGGWGTPDNAWLPHSKGRAAHGEEGRGTLEHGHDAAGHRANFGVVQTPPAGAFGVSV